MEKLDILNREEFVDKLVNLTENISANRTSTSFAINGVWGCGKSFVLDMYEERLNEIPIAEKGIDKYFVIRYNCWKYDYYEEPLVAIVAAMIDIINQKTKLWNDEKKRARVLSVLRAVGVSLLTIGNNAIKDKTGLDIKSAFDIVAKETQKENEKQRKKREYDVNFSFKQSLECLRREIDQLSQEQTVVFMVDELDRCLPEYSIKVLERLHHLTEDSSNVITVLSMDKGQLKKSITQIFGFSEPEKYLEKFIRFEIELNLGTISERFVEKHKDYIDLFDKDKIQYTDSIEEFMQAVFQDIGVREQEQLIHRARLAHSILFDKTKDYSFMCMEVLLVVMKAKYSNCKKFSKWLDAIHATTYVGVTNPPFDDFFTEKFSKCINTNSYLSSYTGKNGRENKAYRIDSNQSLYANILYWWYYLKLESDGFGFYASDMDTRTMLDENLEDLKKYIETINFIK